MKVRGSRYTETCNKIIAAYKRQGVRWVRAASMTALRIRLGLQNMAQSRFEAAIRHIDEHIKEARILVYRPKGNVAFRI